MNKNPLTCMARTALLVTLVSACSQHNLPQEMPTVNDENCKLESIAKINHKDTREKFGSMCFYRGQFKPSPKKGW